MSRPPLESGELVSAPPSEDLSTAPRMVLAHLSWRRVFSGRFPQPGRETSTASALRRVAIDRYPVVAPLCRAFTSRRIRPNAPPRSPNALASNVFSAFQQWRTMTRNAWGPFRGPRYFGLRRKFRGGWARLASRSSFYAARALNWSASEPLRSGRTCPLRIMCTNSMPVMVSLAVWKV